MGGRGRHGTNLAIFSSKPQATQKKQMPLATGDCPLVIYKPPGQKQVVEGGKFVPHRGLFSGKETFHSPRGDETSVYFQLSQVFLIRGSGPPLSLCSMKWSPFCESELAVGTGCLLRSDLSVPAVKRAGCTQGCSCWAEAGACPSRGSSVGKAGSVLLWWH